jgi:hypothetical protein
MFEKTSRYAACEIATLQTTDPDGATREIRYVRRRFIPSAEGMTIIVEHPFTQGERLDNITAKYIGDPTQFWRICDANEVMTPEELEEPGRLIKIAMQTV